MNTSRRTFLRGLLAAGTAPLFLPSRVWSASRGVLPSNKITLGFIGTGDHGRAVNLASLLAEPDAQVVALCDVDRKHLDLAAEMVKTRTGAVLPSSGLQRDWRDVMSSHSRSPTLLGGRMSEDEIATDIYALYGVDVSDLPGLPMWEVIRRCAKSSGAA
jgi:hypothetical protein